LFKNLKDKTGKKTY